MSEDASRLAWLIPTVWKVTMQIVVVTNAGYAWHLMSELSCGIASN
jgi:hypothetical protein